MGGAVPVSGRRGGVAPGARRFAVAVAVAVLVLALGAPGAQARIPLELRFDGHAFAPTAPPDFTCFNYTRGRWVSCRAKPADAPGTYVLEQLEPGEYRMHVSIDENPDNPRRFPGDYEAQPHFEVTDTGPERLIVDLPRLIHLLRPGDNGRALEGMLTSCDTQPRFETPRHAWTKAAPIEFGWEPIVAGAEYRYTVAARSCGPQTQREVLSEKTGATAVTLTLPPSAEGEHYVFRVEAWNGGRLVGDLYTHDGGTHSWNYRFRVRDASVPRWAYVAAGGGLVLLLLAGRRAFVGVRPVERRHRLRLLAGGTVAAVVVAATAAATYYYYQDRERRRADAEKTAVETARQQGQREFIAAFASAAPRPDWWATVETPYRVDNLGDLLSAWQGHPRTPDGERQFFKAAYQGIVDHPDDEHVVATALALLYYVVDDYPYRLGLARFGYDRYFRHHQRTDNCANCMVGDTTQGLAYNLGQLYMAAGRHDEAIEVCRRLIAERSADVSSYKLAETWNQMAWAHWHKREPERALEVVRDALARYGGTVRGEELRRTLEVFERERVGGTPEGTR
jgi:tetratricopeptide (TPR) repeat protein